MAERVGKSRTLVSMVDILAGFFSFSPLYSLAHEMAPPAFSQPSVEISQTYPDVYLSDLLGDLKPQST